MYGSMKDISPENITFCFLGKTMISHFSLEESNVMPWNPSSCPWDVFPIQNEQTMNIMQNARRE